MTNTTETSKTAYTLYDRPGYFRQLASEISRTVKGDRVAVMTMPIDPREPLVMEIIQELCAAATRGVRVIVAVDAISFMITTRHEFKLGPLWFHGAVHEKKGTPANLLEDFPMDAGLSHLKLTPPFRDMYNQLELIRKAGGTYRITNPPTRPFTLPVAGRSHIKLAVVNDVVKLGGCNLEDSADLDIMASSKQPNLANFLFNVADSIVQSDSVRGALYDTDIHFLSPSPAGITNPFDLFFDAGVPKQSRILEEALKFIDDSREWLFFTCQYFPGGIVGKHLAQALARGVQVHVVFSPPSTHGYEQLGHYVYNTAQKLRLSRHLFKHQLPKGFPILHAKLLANEQGAMLGSHNFTTQGVRLGTAEIALHVHNPTFSRQTVEFVNSILPATHRFDYESTKSAKL